MALYLTDTQPTGPSIMEESVKPLGPTHLVSIKAKGVLLNKVISVSQYYRG